MIGMSLDDGPPPSGFRHDTWRRPAGSGDHAFEQATEAIRSWAGHRAAGVIHRPTTPDLAEGTVVALAARAVSLWVTAVCRIVGVIDEPHRFGFVYGTFDHHPECGEEAFIATRDDAGDVVIEISAVSRPSSRLAQLSGPIGRQIQHRTTEKYLDGLSGRA